MSFTFASHALSAGGFTLKGKFHSVQNNLYVFEDQEKSYFLDLDKLPPDQKKQIKELSSSSKEVEIRELPFLALAKVKQKKK